MVRVLVCGSRYLCGQDSLAVFDGLNAIDEQMGEVTTIISGGAKGADSIAEKYAINHGIEFLEFKADWEKHGKAAGPIRNKQMLVEGKPDVVLAVGTNGPGTKNMIKQAYKVDGLEVITIDFEE